MLEELPFTAPEDPAEKEKWLNGWSDWIKTLTQNQCAFLQRYAPVGHPVFNTRYPLYEQFKARFAALGGMTPAVSKAIGWDQHV